MLASRCTCTDGDAPAVQLTWLCVGNAPQQVVHRREAAKQKTLFRVYRHVLAGFRFLALMHHSNSTKHEPRHYIGPLCCVSHHLRSQACRKVLPQPKVSDRSLPVPSGSTYGQGILHLQIKSTM